MTTDDRDRLLDELLPVAAQLVGAVRNRDADHFQELTAPLGRTRLLALLIDVAAMVPDDKTVAELVLWSHGPVVSDEEYQQLTAFSVRPGMKFCRWCQEWWRVEEFSKMASAKDGRRSQCRACRTERSRAGSSDDGEVAA